MGSCNEDAEYYTLETPPDQMHLAPSSENVKLQRVDETQEAISFSWKDAADRGNNTKLTYYFRLYHGEMKSVDGELLESELIKIDEGVRSISMTVRELNNIIYSWGGVTPGDEVTVVAEVLAVVESSPKYMKPEISKAEFNVVGYSPSDILYLTIETGGLKRNIEMTKTDAGIFKWKGNLDVGNFWFVRSSEQGGVPAYMKGSGENTLVYSETGEGNPFNTTRYGEYDITVNLNNLEITITTFFINTLHIVTSKDGVENVVKLYEYEVGTDIYHLEKRFEAGTKFRFVREAETLWPAYVKGADDTKLEFKDESAATMFEITQTNLYKMVINLNDLTINKQVVAPADNLYLITSLNGIESVKQLDKVQAGRNVFYGKVKLDAGTEFRFVTSQNSKWPAYVKGADNTELVYRGEGSEMFKANTTATYVMTVNMEDMSMIFLDVYESSTGVVAVVGGVVSSGWDSGIAVRDCSLTQKDLINRPEVISYTGTFTYTQGGTNDNNAFKFVGNGSWGGASLFATESYANPFDPTKQSVTTDSSGDRKWMLPEGTASGTYTLEMNLHTMQIDLVKQ